jgi:hypothetical protein
MALSFAVPSDLFPVEHRFLELELSTRAWTGQRC